MYVVMSSHIENDFFVSEKIEFLVRGTVFVGDKKIDIPRRGMNFSASAEKIEMFFLLHYV